MINDGRKRITDETNEAYCVACCSYILVVDFYFSLSFLYILSFFFITLDYAGFFSMTQREGKKEKKGKKTLAKLRSSDTPTYTVI